MIETVMMPVEEAVSDEVLALFDTYATWLHRRYGLTRDHLMWLGYNGNVLFDAEQAVLGSRSYATSVIMPIRNLYYSLAVMDKRAETLDTMRLDGPILDYGCGIGFMALYLKRRGHDVYAWDVDGVQGSMAREFLTAHGIHWGYPTHPGTIFCINVLEHLEDPAQVVHNLRAMGGRLHANCDEHEGVGHIASAETRRAVIADLKAHGEYLDFTEGIE